MAERPRVRTIRLVMFAAVMTAWAVSAWAQTTVAPVPAPKATPDDTKVLTVKGALKSELSITAGEIRVMARVKVTAKDHEAWRMNVRAWRCRGFCCRRECRTAATYRGGI